MNLHLFNDEKVVNRTVQYFEDALPGQNKFIVIVPNKEYELKYVKKNPLILCLVYDTPDFWSVVGDVSHYKFIIIHFLDITKASFINKIDHDGIVWMAWGADLYKNLLAPKGYTLYSDSKIENLEFSFKRKLFKPLANYFDCKRYKILLKSVTKVRYFAGLEVDYRQLIEYYPELSSLSYKNFYYYPLDHMLSSIDISTIDQSLDIMVGNSGSLTGNHNLIFSMLNNLSLDKRYKIFCPLSYGNKKYIKKVIKQGYHLFEEAFIPLTAFLKLDAYNKILANCNSFIYGNFRQEAVGNILVALYLGKQVFLHENNPLLSFYKSLGITLYDISNLPDKIDSRLDENIQKKNKDILWKLYNSNHLIKIIQTEFN